MNDTFFYIVSFVLFLTSCLYPLSKLDYKQSGMRSDALHLAEIAEPFGNPEPWKVTEKTLLIDDQRAESCIYPIDMFFFSIHFLN